ncbi:hypothetical protein [Polaribacter gangjinensis]|uniref:hypothetical protein n=1 Tax=Polaribacter gangjinensis TaxID=574710 RepID=UPI0011B025AF|nr:hypothetical protein [Polaribacter gangjinensis]
MKNLILTFFLSFSVLTIWSQISIQDALRTGAEISKNDKKFNELPAELIQTFSFGISLPDDISYHFKNGGGETLKSRLSFELFYTINYPIFKKVTFGLITGFQHQSQGSITAYKLGGLVRYYFKNYDSTNFYIMTARGFGLDSKVENSSGYGNIRFGLEFPIEKYDDYNVIFKIFWDNDSYKLKKPLISNENPRDIIYHSGYGLGIGIRF